MIAGKKLVGPDDLSEGVKNEDTEMIAADIALDPGLSPEQKQEIAMRMLRIAAIICREICGELSARRAGQLLLSDQPGSRRASSRPQLPA